MKKLVIVLALLAAGGCSTAGLQRTSDYCVVADQKLGVYQCDLGNTLCNGAPGGLICWVKAAPSPSPTTAQSPSPVPLPPQKK